MTRTTDLASAARKLGISEQALREALGLPDGYRPILLVVHGLPATGKTTLAQWLAAQLHWPVVHKDALKEILFDTLGWRDRSWSRQLGVATIEVLWHVIELQLGAGISCVAECNFKPALSSPRLRDILSKADARCVQILCQCDSDVRLTRFQSRERHPGHADEEVRGDEAEAWQTESLGPLDVPGPLIKVDTTDLTRVDYDVILRLVRDFVSGQADSSRHIVPD